MWEHICVFVFVYLHAFFFFFLSFYFSFFPILYVSFFQWRGQDRAKNVKNWHLQQTNERHKNRGWGKRIVVCAMPWSTCICLRLRSLNVPQFYQIFVQILSVLVYSNTTGLFQGLVNLKRSRNIYEMFWYVPVPFILWSAQLLSMNKGLP